MNNHKYNEELKHLARVLRNNMTKEEKRLWYGFLKNKVEKFQRQKIIGHYIVDFYCSDLKLVIEVDGIQHTRGKDREYDKKRTEYIEQYGIKVIRFSNKSINQYFIDVCNRINYEISEAIKRKCDING